MEESRKEHIRYCKLHQLDKSAVAQHTKETGHALELSLKQERLKIPQLIKEAIKIAITTKTSTGMMEEFAQHETQVCPS